MHAQSYATVERLHWRLIAEHYWHPDLTGIAHQPIPLHLKGPERVEFYKIRTEAQKRLGALFPPDED